MARLRIVTLGIVSLLVAACGPGGSTAGPSAPGSTQAAPTQAASPPGPETAAPTGDACATESLQTKTAGTLTIGTDNPAYPPYFQAREGRNTEPWDPSQGDPTTGKGFESAVAYAIAEELGFANDDVSWIPIRFNKSFAPGPKDFDLFINQVAFNEQRAENVDLSEGYYFGNQTVVTMEDSEFATATTLTELMAATLGAQVGTTSLSAIEDVIGATPAVYDDTFAAISDMKSGDIDGIVVDLPTAGFVTTVQAPRSTIVGQMGEAAGAEPERFSVVLEKDSALTLCVNESIGALQENGAIEAMTNEWLPFSNTPELLP